MGFVTLLLSFFVNTKTLLRSYKKRLHGNTCWLSSFIFRPMAGVVDALTSTDLEGFSGFAVRSSPYIPGRLAVAAAANYGIAGNGRLLVLDQMMAFTKLTTTAALFDVAWSELSASQLLGAGADGSIRLYDLEVPTEGRPLTAFAEHLAEVVSLDWNSSAKDTFCSSSWDGTVKVWSPERAASMVTFAEHGACHVYEARWAPHQPRSLLTVAGDGTARLWDVAVGPSATAVVACGGGEVLSADWSKYDPNVFATGTVDCAVRLWDARRLLTPVATRQGHSLAVRRVRFSPHVPTSILSASYDATVCLWGAAVVDANGTGEPPTAPVGGADVAFQRFAHHTEFVQGLEWSLFEAGVATSCGWDGRLCAWRAIPEGI